MASSLLGSAWVFEAKLRADVQQGSSILPLEAGKGGLFNIGDEIMVNPGASNEDLAKVVSIMGDDLVVDVALQAHATGEKVFLRLADRRLKRLSLEKALASSPICEFVLDNSQGFYNDKVKVNAEVLVFIDTIDGKSKRQFTGVVKRVLVVRGRGTQEDNLMEVLAKSRAYELLERQVVGDPNGDGIDEIPQQYDANNLPRGATKNRIDLIIKDLIAQLGVALSTSGVEDGLYVAKAYRPRGKSLYQCIQELSQLAGSLPEDKGADWYIDELGGLRWFLKGTKQVVDSVGNPLILGEADLEPELVAREDLENLRTAIKVRYQGGQQETPWAFSPKIDELGRIDAIAEKPWITAPEDAIQLRDRLLADLGDVVKQGTMSILASAWSSAQRFDPGYLITLDLPDAGLRRTQVKITKVLFRLEEGKANYRVQFDFGRGLHDGAPPVLRAIKSLEAQIQEKTSSTKGPAGEPLVVVGPPPADLQSALDRLRSGGTLIIREGVYELDRPLRYYGRLRLRGSGKGITVLKVRDFARRALHSAGGLIKGLFPVLYPESFATGGAGENDIIIENLTIDGNRDNQDTRLAVSCSGAGGPNCAGQDKLQVEEVGGFDVGDTISIGAGPTGESRVIKAIDALSKTFTLDGPLRYDHAAGEPVHNVSKGIIGLLLWKGLNITIRELEVKGCTKEGINVANRSSSIRILGCSVHDNGQDGVIVGGGGPGEEVKRVLIAQSELHNNGLGQGEVGAGINIGDGSSDVTITFNDLHDNRDVGVLISFSERIVIASNHLRSNGASDASRGVGVRLDLCCDDVAIIGNEFSRHSTTAIEPIGTTRSTIAGNVFRDDASAIRFRAFPSATRLVADAPAGSTQISVESVERFEVDDLILIVKKDAQGNRGFTFELKKIIAIDEVNRLLNLDAPLANGYAAGDDVDRLCSRITINGNSVRPLGPRGIDTFPDGYEHEDFILLMGNSIQAPEPHSLRGRNDLMLGMTPSVVHEVIASSNHPWLQVKVKGDTSNRLQAFADGTLQWGPGDAAWDTDLFRAGPGTLGTSSEISLQQGKRVKWPNTSILEHSSGELRLLGRSATGWHPSISFFTPDDTGALSNKFHIIGGIPHMAIVINPRPTSPSITDTRSYITMISHRWTGTADRVFSGKLQYANNGEVGVFEFRDTDWRLAHSLKDDGSAYHKLALGIGVTNPSDKLHIHQGNARVQEGRLILDAAIAALGLTAGITGEPNNRFEVWHDGTLRWGDGSKAPDVNLYRSAADVLASDDAFSCKGPLLLTGNSFGDGFIKIYRFDHGIFDLQRRDYSLLRSWHSRFGDYLRLYPVNKNSFLLYLSTTLYGALLVGARSTDSVTITIDSPSIILEAQYWDGTTNMVRDAIIKHRMLSAAPSSRLEFLLGGTLLAWLDDRGAFNAQSYQVNTVEVIDANRLLRNIAGVEQSWLPSLDVAYDLGSPSKRWRHLYLSLALHLENDQPLLWKDSSGSEREAMKLSSLNELFIKGVASGAAPITSDIIFQTGDANNPQGLKERLRIESNRQQPDVLIQNADLLVRPDGVNDRFEVTPTSIDFKGTRLKDPSTSPASSVGSVVAVIRVEVGGVERYLPLYDAFA